MNAHALSGFSVKVDTVETRPVVFIYYLFSFRKFVQNYTDHIDMEIVIFVGIKG